MSENHSAACRAHNSASRDGFCETKTCKRMKSLEIATTRQTKCVPSWKFDACSCNFRPDVKPTVVTGSLALFPGAPLPEEARCGKYDPLAEIEIPEKQKTCL